MRILQEQNPRCIRYVPITAPALFSTSVPDSVLPPPSMEVYLPTSMWVAVASRGILLTRFSEPAASHRQQGAFESAVRMYGWAAWKTGLGGVYFAAATDRSGLGIQ